METDCLLAANFINGTLDYSSHHYAPIIDLCRSALASLTEFRVDHILREGNQVVDCLAKVAGQIKKILLFLSLFHLQFLLYLISIV